MTRPRKNPGASGIRTQDLPLSRRTPYHWANEAVDKVKESKVRILLQPSRLPVPCLTLNFPVAVANTLNAKTHSSKEMAEFSFENADFRSILLLQTVDEKQTVTFVQNVSKRSSVSRGHLSPHTYTAGVA